MEHGPDSSSFQPENVSSPDVSASRLDPEQKRVRLHPAEMAALSMSDYIDRWRTLNPQYLSHATRQGFRDHIHSALHTDGLEEFHTGLTGALQDGKMLRPSQAVRNFRIGDEDSLRTWLAGNEGWR